MKVAFHPGLYDPEGGDLALSGARCGRCGRVCFPPSGIGCEVCGAPGTALRPEQLTAAGVVHSVATVYLYSGADITAPFTMAEIRLDASPLIRATLTELADPAVIGSRAEGRWVPVRADDAGAEVTELRFAVAPS
jgi:uncharacterized OB-fold protein